MSLIPAADDPNRKAELKRMQASPEAYDGNRTDPTPSQEQLNMRGSGLVEDAHKPSGDNAENAGGNEGSNAENAGDDAGWNDYLAQPVNDLVPELKNLSDVQLEAMREVELRGKARVTLLSAIDEELSQRQGA